MTNARTASTTARTYLELLHASTRSNENDLDFTFPLPTPFVLDYGTLTTPTLVKARLVGPKKAPVILALGGISANRHPYEIRSKFVKKYAGWWPGIVGPALVLDTTRYQILSFDFFPGEADTDRDFAKITPADQARIAAELCHFLEVPKLHAFVGCSYGGMVALSFARLFPEKLERLITLCASHHPHPMGLAWRSIQRKIVQLGLDTNQPDRALSLARELGMTTYRTAQEFGTRFRSQTDVQHYLESRGQEFLGKMSSQRYLILSESIDLHQIDPQEIPVPTTLIGFRQDQLVPVSDLRMLAQQLPQLAGYFETDSIYGHDAFLKEIPFLSEALRQALTL